MTRVEQVRMAWMILNGCQTKPETVEEVMAQIEKIIKKLKLDS
jgi:PBP1b-binding outer membrane lipoprotein LpoB